MWKHPTPQAKPLALKKEATNRKKKELVKAKGTGAKAKGARQCMKSKLSTRELEILEEWEADEEEKKLNRKRVHSKAYHAAFKLARLEGEGAEQAKARARKAGADAARAWAENGKK